MGKRHHVESITFSGDMMKLRKDGCDYRISLAALAPISNHRLKASRIERATYTVQAKRASKPTVSEKFS